MSKRFKDITEERREWAAYSIFYFFVVSFIVKTFFGMMAGSRALVAAGIVTLFGVFISSIPLIRISSAKAPRSIRASFNLGKIEFIVVAGISVVIVIFTGSLLFSVIHMIFFHTLYPPELSGAWMALLMAAASVSVMVWIKKHAAELTYIDKNEVAFAFDADFILSILSLAAIVVSRMGFAAADYLAAVIMSLSAMIYSVLLLYRSLTGLMDASCDKKTVSKIEEAIRGSHPLVDLESLRVSKVGYSLEIIAMLCLGGDTTLTKVRDISGSIRSSVSEKITEPHELFIGTKGKSSVENGI